MPVTLSDIKRTISHKRGDGARVDVPYLQPYLIIGDELAMAPAVAKAIALFAEHTGKPRSHFDSRTQEEALRPLCGDYRIARCLIAALMSFYEYRVPVFAEILQADMLVACEKHGLGDSMRLRLAFYEFINRVGAGFVQAAKRDVALSAFLHDLAEPALSGLSGDQLLDLLYLDSEQRALLQRAADQPDPTPSEVIRRFNAMTVSTLVFSGTQIVLSLRQPEGTLVKNIYRLVRFHYLHCEIERDRQLWQYGESEIHATSSGDLDIWSGPLTMIIAGPDDAFGSATRWGERLARLAPRLLRLLVAHKARHFECYAAIQINKRPYRLQLDAELARAIGDAQDVQPGDDSYDSSVEESFAREFSSLFNQGQTSGWNLEREPAPIIVDAIEGPSVFIPDFAFARGDIHVYLEIIGFWTTAYKEKKRRKLERLRGRLNLALATSADAAAAFADLGFPLLVYDNFPTVTEMVTMLNYHFSDWDARRSALPGKARALANLARVRGLVDEQEVMQTLACYTRGELRQALPLLVPLGLAEQRESYGGKTGSDALQYIDGLGLISSSYLSRADALLEQILATAPAGSPPQVTGGTKNARNKIVVSSTPVGVPLNYVLDALQHELGPLDQPEALLEALGMAIVRDSLFDAYVTRPAS